MEPESHVPSAAAARASSVSPTLNIHDPIDPAHGDFASPLYNNVDLCGSSPLAGELNRAHPSSLSSSANSSAALPTPGMASFGVFKATAGLQQRQQFQHQQPLHSRTERSLNGSSNRANPKMVSLPQQQQQQQQQQEQQQQLLQRTHGVSPPSPVSAATLRAVPSGYTPLRLDSQLLASPWPGGTWSAGHVPSPTRHISSSAPIPLTSCWNANASPPPYPCGSPTVYSGAYCIVSPSTQSLRLLPPQHVYSNDGASPVQLSISNLGHDNSFLAAPSCTASPGTAGAVHSAILDAPLQVSLVPPPHRDDWPLFSFGTSIMQSAPYTPTLQTPTSRGLSIYHDTMIELACHKSEVDNPLSAALQDSSRVSASAAATATTTGGAGPVAAARTITTTTTTTAAAASTRGQLFQCAVSAMSDEASASNTEILASMGTLDWQRLGRPSPTSPTLHDQLTSRPGDRPASSLGSNVAAAADDDDDDEEYEDEEEEQRNELEVQRGRANSTPEALASTGRDMQGVAAAAAAAAADTDEPSLGMFEEPAQQAALSETARPTSVDRRAGTASLSLSTLAYSELAGKAAASSSSAAATATTPIANTLRGVSGQMATPLLHHPPRSTFRPHTPSGVAAVRSTHDFHVFMPSPIDQGAHVFGAVRDSAPRTSSSEQSASTLSLAPGLAAWQTSPTLLTVLHSTNRTPTATPGAASSLRDLLEVLRLLQSDIDNVFGRVAASEHVVRRWITSTLSRLLQLTAELVHSASLAALQVADEAKEPGTEGTRAATFAKLRDDIAATAASCGETLRKTIAAVRRDQEHLEPLLLTSMLARGPIASLLQWLEKPLVTAKAAHQTPSTTTSTTTTSATEATLPSLQGNSAPAAVTASATAAAPLTPERIDKLMDGHVLAEELDTAWPHFVHTYNRQVLRYHSLRAVYVLLSSKEDTAGDGAAEQRSDGRRRNRTSNSTGGDVPFDATTVAASAGVLEGCVETWVDEQMEHWATYLQPPMAPSQRHRDATLSKPAVDEDGGGAEVRESLCSALPSFKDVTEVLNGACEGDGWRWWYGVLSRAMSCRLHAREDARHFERVKAQLSGASSEATAVRAALARHALAAEEVEAALEAAEARLSAMEEDGRARRLSILQRILRRMFVLGVVASVHGSLGKDAPVSAPQLAAHVQVHRKSLEEVEAQLGAHHAECIAHVRHIHSFLTLFSDDGCGASLPSRASQWPTHRAALADPRSRASPSHLGLRSNSSLDQPSEDTVSRWNSPSVASLAALLLVRPRPDRDVMQRSDSSAALSIAAADALTDGSDDDGTRAAAALVRDVTVRLATTVQSLCALLQSDADEAEAHKLSYASPAKLPAPSTRALRRLQASLSEAHHCTRVTMASLRLID
ncbi:hypothetical protein NESM_000138000 [Novymonas esmeraldas]|uniref:Uncharacterized protein n=1 Tax=Novymonas esmeraldas TaxID=1808958 RepID=A0AAW0F4V7_9TRYP